MAWQSSIVWDDTLLCLNDDDIKKCKWGQIKCLHRWRDEEEDVSPLARSHFLYFATSLVFASCCLLLRPRVYDLFAECGRNDINLTVATINRTSRRLTSLNNSKQKFISNLHHVYSYGRTHFLPLCLTLLEIEINIFQLIYLQKEKVSRRMKQLNVYLLTNSEHQQTITTSWKIISAKILRCETLRHF